MIPESVAENWAASDGGVGTREGRVGGGSARYVPQVSFFEISLTFGLGLLRRWNLRNFWICGGCGTPIVCAKTSPAIRSRSGGEAAACAWGMSWHKRIGGLIG